MTCWLSNPSRYRKEYFEIGDKLDTKYLRFGKGIAKLIEDGKHTELLPDLIVYDTPEHEIKVEVNGVPVLSYLDSYNSVDNIFREYKTGKIPWTQAKVQKHDQLLFYATALKWSTGKVPDCCDLDWIETIEGEKEEESGLHNERQVNTTGKIKSFHREFDNREIERMEELILKVAEEISEAYIKFIEEI
jgi:hypothetical protein